MTTIKYWQEALEYAFDEVSMTATPEQFAALARKMQFASEMYAEYSGELNIPNPLLAEVAEAKRRVKAESDRCENAVDHLLGVVAYLGNAPREDVYFDGQRVRVR